MERNGNRNRLVRPADRREDPISRLLPLGTDQATIMGIRIQGRQATLLPAGNVGEVFLDQTPFYAETGGQVGDTGVLQGVEAEAVVRDTFLPIPATRRTWSGVPGEPCG